MEPKLSGGCRALCEGFAFALIAATPVNTSATDIALDGPTQVVTVYFAGTLLTSHTVFRYGGTTRGVHAVPELLQYLYENQDVSDPNQHKIWIDGIGSREEGYWDAGLAARHANNCSVDRAVHADPWDSNRTTLKFNRGYGLHLAGFECWDYRLHEALDSNNEADLFDIIDGNRTSPVILNILGHSRGGILAMMLAHKVVRLERRYERNGEVFPEHRRFHRINIVSFDAVPGNPAEIGLFDVGSRKFKGSLEYFSLSPQVSNYVGFYAKDERQNIFQAVIPDHTGKTKVWHLALNGAHQTMVGNPRRDGHEYEPAFLGIRGAGSEDFSSGKFDSTWDEAAASVASVTNIITRELLKSENWGSVRFEKPWRSNLADMHHGAAQCEDNEAACARYFLANLSKQASMPKATRVKMRSVAHPGYSALAIPEGGLQAWSRSRSGFKPDSGCNVRVKWHHARRYGYKSYGSPPEYFAGDEFGKCTYKAYYRPDGTRLNPVPLIDTTTDRSASGIPNHSPHDVCRKLVELTDLDWRC